VLAASVVTTSCSRGKRPAGDPAATTSPVQAAGSECERVSQALKYRFESANYWDHDITVLRDQQDMQACARACDENPACKVATFSDSTITDGWANSCVLRGAVGTRHPEPSGRCSWVKPAKN
jgi:hypothetical protein